MESSDQIRMVLSFSLRHQGRLSRLITQLNDPSSPIYHQWLTPEEFGQRFGRTEAEFNQALSWLQSQGFNVDRPYPSRLAIGFTGSTAVVERAFGVQMGLFWDSNGGRSFYSNSNEPTLPPELNAITVGLQGLNNALLYHHIGGRNKMRPISRQELKTEAGQGGPRPDLRVGSSTNIIGPSDLALLYDYQPLWNANIKGSGQKVGIIIDSDIKDSDMSTYRSLSGLPATTVQRVVLSGFTNPGITAGEDEADVDTQSVSAAAPMAEIDLLLVPSLDTGSILTVESDIVNQVGTLNIHIVNESFGLCESEIFNASERTVFQQAVAQGIAIFASSGDEGANCDEGDPTLHGVECPACYDGATAVGGTTLNVSYNTSGVVTARTSEVTWNSPPGVRQDCTGGSLTGGSTGGGVSGLVSMPTYQVNSQGFAAGVPAGSKRIVPDIAAIADPNPPSGCLLIIEGLGYYGGGTSQSSPLWAGMMALINNFKGSVQGSPNTALYQLGVNQFKNGGPAAYLDITSGNNNVGPVSPCLPSGFTGFSAKSGYDPVTGWGVPDLNVIANNFGGATASGDTVGLYSAANSVSFLRFSNASGPADLTFQYGPANSGWIPVVGDWDGNGTVTPGLYNPATGFWFLKNSNSGGAADIVFQYGPANAGWIPVVGDWDGNGTDTVGLYNPATSVFFLKNTNSAGAADTVFQYGPANSGWMPLAGRWTGTPADTVGLYSPANSVFFLKNTNTAGAADSVFQYGPANSGWTPVVGDWTGSGTETVGFFAPANATWFLKNSNAAGSADIVFAYGFANGAPLTGKWH
jgi:subtilase family serine protease